MKKISIQYYSSKVGELILGSFDNKLCLLDWKDRTMRERTDNRIKKGLNAEYLEESSELIETTKGQLEEYLNGSRKVFDIPLLMVGTDFQKRVWAALMNVPYGKTATYLQLAEAIDNKKAVRAVAGANGANAMSLIIPCHRIIGSNGQLTGYAGGLAAKKRLLALEQGDSI